MKLYSQSLNRNRNRNHNHNPSHNPNHSPSPLYQNSKKLNKNDKRQKQLKLILQDFNQSQISKMPLRPNSKPPLSQHDNSKPQSEQGKGLSKLNKQLTTRDK